MAYVPPHRRSNSPSLTPSQLSNSDQKKKKPYQGGYIAYAKSSISRWFVVPFKDSDDDDDDEELPCLIRLTEFQCESAVERRDCQKPMVLVFDHHPQRDVQEIANSSVKTPWVSIMQKIHVDLLTSIENARSEICHSGPGVMVPHFILRFGKVLFRGIPSSSSLDDLDKRSVLETTLSRLKRTYHANIPKSFLEAILADIVHKIEMDFDREREYYTVKVIDKFRPDVAIICKGTVTENLGELDLYKIEINEMRHLVVDISCLDKSLDLRLMLSSKRFLTTLTDDEKHTLSDLFKSAIIDSEVKGGLRWPLGKESDNNRYVVIQFGHYRTKIFKNSFTKIKLRHADRFDCTTSTGEVAQEASLRMTELDKHMKDETLDIDLVTDMVRDTLKLAWNHFICWDGSFC